MAKFGTKFESARQDWETPDSIFVPLDREFHFTLDVCATEENAKVRPFYSKEIDGLKQEWVGNCWMNPPFGEQGKWVKKAFESKEAMVIALLPARTNTRWWHDYCMRAMIIRFIIGRPMFVGAEHGLPQPLAIVTFNYGRSYRPVVSGFDLKTGRDVMV